MKVYGRIEYMSEIKKGEINSILFPKSKEDIQKETMNLFMVVKMKKKNKINET